MSIDNSSVVDAVHIDSRTGDVILTITDHLGWADSSGEHILLLQEKINSYLRFIEGGDLLRAYPKAIGRPSVIDVVGMYPLSDEAKRFYELATPKIEAAGIGFRFRLSSESSH